MELLVAFSTHDGENLVTDDHAGQAKYFDVYRISEAGSEFVERRENAKYGGDEAMAHGDPRKARSSLSVLEGVQVWVNPRFGPNLPRLLQKLLCVVVRVETVDEAAELIGGNLAAVAREHARGPERQHLVLKPQ